MKIIDSQPKDIASELKRIINRGETATEEVAIVVKEIIERVRKQGDPAVLEYTEKFDRVTLTLKDLKVSPEEIRDAYTKVETKKVDALKLAAQNIRAFHEKQKISTWVNQEADGVILGQLARPIRSVGVYVPGGKACYPSSVLMNVIPAMVAGVEQIVMCSPVPGGNLNPYILVAADIAGVREIYKIGGAQAVAAMAYGTATIPKVDKIVGPGNIYVATAKRYCFRPGGHRHDRGTERDPGHRGRARRIRRSWPRTCCRRRSTTSLRPRSSSPPPANWRKKSAPRSSASSRT